MSTATIDAMIEATIGKEGGYVNHRADRGGATRWGITEAVARRHGYAGDMRLLPRATAIAIYRQEFLIDPGFAAVAEISPAIAEELFDTGVNMGPTVPALWLQEYLNLFNDGATLYPDIAEDADKPGGGIGPQTLGTLRAYLRIRGADAERVMLRALNASQGERYKQLGRRRGANEAFAYGWFRTRVA